MLIMRKGFLLHEKMSESLVINKEAAPPPYDFATNPANFP
jgi:hypothetical protein